MDITPPHRTRTDSPSTSTAIASATKPVSIETLKLVPGQTYAAKVLAPHAPRPEADPPVPTAPATTPANSSAEQARQPNPQPLPSAVAQWLVLIKDKPVLVSTNIELSLGQLLEIKLRPASGLASAPVLLIAPNTPNAQPQTNQSAISQNVSVLLKAMSQTLPRQVSLDLGLSTLIQQAKQPLPGAPVEPVPAGQTGTNPGTQGSTTLAYNALQLMKPLWPNKADLIVEPQTNKSSPILPLPLAVAKATVPELGAPPTPAQAQHQNANSPTTASPHQVIRNALIQSGSFLENTLLSIPAQKSFMALQMALIDSALQLSRAGSPSSPLPTSNSSRDSSPKNAPQAALSQVLTSYQQLMGAPSPDQANRPAELIAQLRTLHSAISPEQFKSTPKVYDTLISLKARTLELAGQLAPLMSSNSSTDTPSADLKSALVGIIAALSDATSVGAAPQNFVDGSVQQNLLTSPFAFPHPAASVPLLTAAMKADASLSEQELTTGQILKLLAGMLNRLQFNQLNSLYQSQNSGPDNTSNQSWLFELPVATSGNQTDLFNLRIDKEPPEPESQTDGGETTLEQWRVNLTFSLEALGKLTVQAKLAPPLVSTTIWSESQKILDLVNKEQHQLRDRLTQIGLQVTEFHCLHGQPVNKRTHIDKQLVDTRA